jgi:hypothetical protein
VCDAFVEPAANESRADPRSQARLPATVAGPAQHCVDWLVGGLGRRLSRACRQRDAEIVSGSAIAIIGARGATLLRAQR